MGIKLSKTAEQSNQFEILYEERVVKEDIPKIDKSFKERIKLTIENKLKIDPLSYGKPLRRSLKGYRKLRVGDFRIIFRIKGEKVKIFAIMHRSVIYSKDKKTKFKKTKGKS